MSNITTNKDFATELQRKIGGNVLQETGNAIVWYYNKKRYQVRVSEKSINVNMPTSFPVDGIVFFLSDNQVWGVIDSFDKKTLDEKDANQGIWE